MVQKGSEKAKKRKTKQGSNHKKKKPPNCKGGTQNKKRKSAKEGGKAKKEGPHVLSSQTRRLKMRAKEGEGRGGGLPEWGLTRRRRLNYKQGGSVRKGRGESHVSALVDTTGGGIGARRRMERRRPKKR